MPGPGPIPRSASEAMRRASAGGSTSGAERPVARLGVAVKSAHVEDSGTGTPPTEPPSEPANLEEGLTIVHIVKGSPADKVGLRQGDVLMRFDAQILFLPKQLELLVKRSDVGARARLAFTRPGSPEAQVAEVILDAAPPVSRPLHPQDVLTDTFKVTHRVVRMMVGTTTIALSTRNERAYLEISDATNLQFSKAVSVESDIPPDTLERIKRIADLEEGQWKFKLPILPPVPLQPDEGPRSPAPVPD